MISKIIWTINADKTITKVTKETNKLFANGEASTEYGLVSDDITTSDVVIIIANRGGNRYEQRLKYQRITFEDGTSRMGWATVSNGAELNFDLQSGTENIAFNFEIKRFNTLDPMRTLVTRFTTQQDIVPVYPASTYVPEVEPTDAEQIINDLNALEVRVTDIEENIGDLSELETEEQSTLVGAINEVNTKVEDASGDIEALEQRVAQNEQDIDGLDTRLNSAEINVSNLQSNVGSLTNLNTEDKSNLVNAINEVLENAGGADEEFVRGLINEHNNKSFTQGVHPDIKTYVDNQNNLQNLNINENTSDITDINTLLNNIVPGEASAQNELADKAFVNSTVNSLAAFYITKNAAGDSFETYDELSEAETYYSGGEVRIPTRNDYAIVRTDSLHDDATTRYIYNNGWEYQFTVNETPLTAAQLATLNSGLVAADKAKIENALEKVKTQTVGQNTTEVDITNSGFDLGITFKENGTTLKQVTLNKDGLSVVDADTQEYVRPIINGSEQMAFLSDAPAVDGETIVTNSDNELEAVGLKGTTESVTADEILEAITITYVGGE